MSVTIGVIAEGQSDVDVLREIITKISSKKFKLKRFLGHGCGKLRAKCAAWAGQLHIQGCRLLIVVHDLDNYKVGELRSHLQNAISSGPIKNNIIVIPVRQIEAWLLSDVDAIKKAMNLKRDVKCPLCPEGVPDAKRKLGEVIYQASKKEKRYLNTTDNKAIAAKLNLSCVRRLPSFEPLYSFLSANL